MTQIGAAEFLKAFRARREYCRAVLELSRQQAALISRDDYAELLEVLSQKQKILNHMEEHQRQSALAWSHWQQERSQLSREQRQACDDVLAEIETLLAELLQQEQDSTDLLTSRRETTRRELLAVSETGHVHEAYRESVATTTHRRLNVDG